jgi:hypothetical protein
MFHVLPGPGGVMQQNPKHIRKLLAASDALSKYREYEIEKETNK